MQRCVAGLHLKTIQMCLLYVMFSNYRISDRFLLKMGHTCQGVKHTAVTDETYTIVLHQNSFGKEGSVPVNVVNGTDQEVEVIFEFCFYEGMHSVLL